MKIIHTILLLLVNYIATAQTGELYGTVLDEKKQPVTGATILLLQNGMTKGAAVSDYDGNYLAYRMNTDGTRSTTPMDTGVYRMMIICVGYDTFFVNKLKVNGRMEQNAILYSCPDYRIRGTVITKHGKAIAGAMVQMYRDTSLVVKCHTEEDGSFYLRVYIIGPHYKWSQSCRLKVTHNGRRTVTRKLALMKYFTSYENITLRRKWWQSKK